MTQRTLRQLLLVVASLAAFGVLAGYGWLVWRAPRLLVPGLRTPPPTPSGTTTPVMTPAEQATAAHNVRVLVVSLAGAVVVLAGLLYTARTYRLSHRGQVTDRFSKALERLGSEELYVRIGGIHALQQVLRDSPEQHAEVLDVLVAFIRQRVRPVAPKDDTAVIYPRPALPSEPAADVQAALTALAQRHRRSRREPARLNLAELHLAGIHLPGAQLQGANLGNALLQDANLSNALLQDANLSNAQLLDAKLRNADLHDANLDFAELHGATLTGAQLQGANLAGAQLQKADLNGAQLQGAKLFGAQLQGAQLILARLEGAKLGEAQLQDAELSRAQLQGANLAGEKPFGPAQGMTAEQLASATLDESTRLPDGLRDDVETYRRLQ